MSKLEQVRKFIDILDRYLEVAFVYHERMSAMKSDDINDRVKRVVEDLEKIVLFEGKTVHPIPEGEGQNIAPDEMFFKLTKIYQEIISTRLSKGGVSTFEPRNKSRILKLMQNEPEIYLGMFDSVSYAWDVLNETASLCFLPQLVQLERRDLLCMHSLELRQHLSRVYAQELVVNPNSVLSLQGEFSIGKLEKNSKIEDLVRMIVSQPIYWNNDFNKLATQVKSFFTKKAEKLYSEIGLDEIEEKIVPYLDENLEFSNVGNEKVVKDICPKMVVYGLCVSYLAWISVCEMSDDKINTELLTKHMLFTTRTLLDEKYWDVCIYVADLACKYRELLNKESNVANTKDKTYMLFANKVFAEKMAKSKSDDQIKKEINSWDLSMAHSRYMFLKYILLEDYARAKDYGEKLLVMDDNNQINITSKELLAWPILEDFRTTNEGQQLIEYAREVENRLGH